MAAIDYSASAPKAANTLQVESGQVKATEEEKQPVISSSRDFSPRDIKNDVVSLRTTNNHFSATQNQVTSSKPTDNQPKDNNANASVPAPIDSLSALLNRQVQQTNTNAVAASNHESVALQEKSIEQQFKRFTEKLEKTNDSSSNNHHRESAELDEMMFTEPTMQPSLSKEASMANKTSNVQLDDFEKMKAEMASIRQLLEHQVSGLMWQDMAQKDPKRAVLVNRLMSLGLTEQISDQIAGYVPSQSNEDQAWQQALQLIKQQLNTTNNDIMQRGGVVALVGATGVGKTTTIAKLAARFSQLHGADQVALISTDTFRIAGFEQLETYGRIIGCQVKLAKDAQALDSLLQQYAKKKLVLIDTAGMGQRDLRLAKHLSTLVSNARLNIRNYLVIAANTQQRVMQENVERFKKVPLSGTIYTKLDESISIGEIISTSIQNGLPIGYLTDGQQVPEDIKVANVEKLVTLADKMANKLQFQHSAIVRATPMVQTEMI
jgi:flagellar biosynthesis protein FlhF